MKNKEEDKPPFARNRLDYIINLINPRKNQKVLNLGISNIPEVEMAIEDRVKECHTIDIDKKKMNTASKHLKKTKIMDVDITKPNKIKKNYYDAVVMIEVLEHLKDDRAALQWISSVLKKNGSLIIGVPNDAFLHYFNPVKYAEHERHYSNSLIKNRLKEAGFQIKHFNLVECWTLLASLYIHLFRKFILKQNRAFGIFKKTADKTYRQYNRTGMDILIKAQKVKNFK